MFDYWVGMSKSMHISGEVMYGWDDGSQDSYSGGSQPTFDDLFENKTKFKN